ncbi:hypothetical protein B0H66DRAFT_587776 [Apodospora peruviana]|uniref:Uncharacterized protein n=1 Tax=Apodospora peruviana TaxID=516989 RepID=A0AAE0IH47_9PEZI|nr:hypothetical protein B0H66DRAFT_587776 [Apodospora peruviana]
MAAMLNGIRAHKFTGLWVDELSEELAEILPAILPADLETHSLPVGKESKDCRPENNSGYGSNDATESTRAESFQEEPRISDCLPDAAPLDVAAKPTCRPARPPKRFALAHRKDPLQVDQPPPVEVRNSWADICGPLSVGLADELRRNSSGASSQAASMRLVMLGKSGNDRARPCIVVFCLEAHWKQVRKFFKQRKVRDLLERRPGPVGVFGLMDDDEEAWNPALDPTTTLCGLSIMLMSQESSGEARTATLGGIIKVTDASNQVVCYGLTAGHVMPAAASLPLPGKSLTFGVSNDGTTMDVDPDWEEEAARACAAGLCRPQFLGSVVDECILQHVSEDGKYYDWALCALSSGRHLLPNQLRETRHSSKPPDHGKRGPWCVPELQTIDTTFKTAIDDISVVVMTGSSGLRHGWLSTLPCPVMFGPAEQFITAYTITFLDEDTICDGDSGSWVVNEDTLEVVDIFEDIKRRLGAKSVELASASTIRSIGAVFDSLNMVGARQLDAIRGNGGPSREGDAMRWQLDAMRGNMDPMGPLPLRFPPMIDDMIPQN